MNPGMIRRKNRYNVNTSPKKYVWSSAGAESYFLKTIGLASTSDDVCFTFEDELQIEHGVNYQYHTLKIKDNFLVSRGVCSQCDLP